MGFHRTVLLKRAARFFFYCQKIIKVFLTIRVMPHKHSGEKNIISANLPCSIIVHRQGKPYIITIPPHISHLLHAFFSYFPNILYSQRSGSIPGFPVQHLPSLLQPLLLTQACFPSLRIHLENSRIYISFLMKP